MHALRIGRSVLSPEDFICEGTLDGRVTDFGGECNRLGVARSAILPKLTAALRRAIALSFCGALTYML
jgi:hypothetical protein